MFLSGPATKLSMVIDVSVEVTLSWSSEVTNRIESQIADITCSVPPWFEKFKPLEYPAAKDESADII